MSASRADITDHFIRHVGSKGKKPDSVYTFMDSMDAKEEDFFALYKSISELEKDAWLRLFETTLAKTEAEDAFAEYSVREKMLSFAFTIVEVLKPHREFSLYYSSSKWVISQATPDHLRLSYEYFSIWAKQLVAEGAETGEMANRLFISQKYPDGLWLLVLSILKYWLRDSSEEYDKTDTFIEKSTNFCFDALGVTPLDSGFDFAKFLFQQNSKKDGQEKA